MRIAFFTDTFLPEINGVSITNQKLLECLNKRQGHEYIVFAPGPALSTDINIYRLPGISFILYPECRISLPKYFFIVRVLDKFKPDMVHISTPFSIGLCGLYYARKRGIPVTAVYHTNFNQYLTYYRLKSLNKIAWNYFKWFYDNCDINYCPSLYTRDELLSRGFKNLELWVRGVDTSLFTPEYRGEIPPPYYHLQGKTVLLYVGRVAAEKNIQVLMGAMDLINRYYYSRVHLFIVGNGPMLDQVERWRPDNVTCTGYITGVSLAKMYANADIFVFPSTSETFGNVILEAMASGLPVVGAYAAGVRDNLIDGVNGISCRPDDSKSVANGVIKLLRDEILRTRLGEQAYAYANSRSLEAGFEQLIKGWEILFSKPVSTIPAAAN